MASYTVIWTIDIEADDVEDAARQARAIQLDPESIATVFTVLNYNGADVTVDLADCE